MKKNMKKVLFIFVSLFWFLSCLFAQNLTSQNLDMEVQKYYWIVPLILNVHMEIGKWQSDDETLASYMVLLQDMKYYADLDIIDLLNNSVYPFQSLESLLLKMENTINNAMIVRSQLNGKLPIFIQTKSECDESKKISDKNFSYALKDFDSANMEKYINESIKYESCSSESRIYYNVYSKIISQLDLYYDVLKNKHDYFYDYKYELIENSKWF